MTEMLGKFITLEGGEGVGKSTNLATVTKVLSDHEIPFIVTREPGGTPFAERIRDLLLAPSDEPVDALSELLLIFAARAQHISKRIRPTLAQGTWVVCDRFTDATYAYQGGGREISIDWIATLEDLVQAGLKPDLTLILDLDPRLGLLRAQQRGLLDRFESEKLQFFEAVRATYLQRAALEPSRCKLINAGADLEQVKAQVEDVLQGFIGQQR